MIETKDLEQYVTNLQKEALTAEGSVRRQETILSNTEAQWHKQQGAAEAIATLLQMSKQNDETPKAE